jgi:hypothetical protein
MLSAPGHVFSGTEGVGSRFHILRSRTHFMRYWGRRVPFFVLRAQTHFLRFRGRRVPFSCFPLPNIFSAVPRASGPAFMFCVPVLIFGGTEGVMSRFHVLCFRTGFRRCRVRRVPFFMFCAPELIFGGTVGVGSRFHVLCNLTRFRRFRGRRVSFSCFARPKSFSAVLRESCPGFMFCAPRLVFGGAKCVGSRFHILGSRTRFRQY